MASRSRHRFNRAKEMARLNDDGKPLEHKKIGDMFPRENLRLDSPELIESLNQMNAANDFLKENNGRDLIRADDPRIYVLDQYIKQILEIFVHTKSHGLKQLVAVCGGSPMEALYAMWQKSLTEKPDDAFLALGLERLAQDLEFKNRYQMGDRAAGAKLRSRGLMR